ncbi:MAG: prohibitin family protein [Syntrophobacteraceae bacterium]
MTSARVRDLRNAMLVGLFIFLLLLAYLGTSVFVTIEPGCTGVLFRRLWGGTELDRIYGEGLHLVAPWNQMHVYDARIQELKQDVAVLSQNGLTVQVLTSVRFRVMRDLLPVLHQKVGPDYKEKIIVPILISSVREVIGKHLPEDLYTTAKQQFQDEILVEQIEETGRIPIVYNGIVVENIKLPDMINQAIEAKLRQQQEYLEYEFRIKKAKEEVRRKQIEAEGIKLYQEAIARSVTPDLLKWLGIKATLELSKSSNAKIVVIGSGEDGLPLILNGESGGAIAPEALKEPSGKESPDSRQSGGEQGVGAESKAKEPVNFENFFDNLHPEGAPGE